MARPDESNGAPARLPAGLVPTQRTPPPPAGRTRALRRRWRTRAALMRRWRARQPWLALLALVMLAFASGFIAWVAAEPFWISVGHASAGTATVTTKGSPATCDARFVADNGAFSVSPVRLSLVEPVCEQGTTLPARMVSAQSGRAYVGALSGLRVRWGVGLGMLLLFGVAIAWLTGAFRRPGWRRVGAVALSLSGPILIAATMLLMTY